MTSSDTFDVTFAWSQTGPYAPGATITGSITGDDVLTTTTTEPIGPLTLTYTAADGATTVVTAPAGTYQQTVATPESVKITGVVDNSANPLTWTIASNGLSISAVAP